MLVGSAGGRVVASPYARKLAREAGVDVGLATGSGPNGRIVAADVQLLVKSGAPARAPKPSQSMVPCKRQGLPDLGAISVGVRPGGAGVFRQPWRA